MLSRNERKYEKKEPVKDAKKLYLFCEGKKTEIKYFYFFAKLASQISIQIVQIDAKNHPIGLYNNACEKLIKNEQDIFNQDIDEIWFVLDTDERDDEIILLRESVANHNNWFVVQSNRSFEVWLYYHFETEKPTEEIGKNWKNYLNEKIKGGFDTRKHPILIETAIKNAKTNFSDASSLPDVHETQVYELAEKILPFVKDDIDKLLTKNNTQTSKKCPISQ